MEMREFKLVAFLCLSFAASFVIEIKKSSQFPAVLFTSYEIPIQDFRNIEYSIEIEIGNPGQKFLVQLDTGSQNLWIPGPNCQECTHKKFNGLASSSYNPSNKSFSYYYGSGKVSGMLSYDNVKLGNLTIKNQEFGQAENLTFTDSKFDGILGLGLSSGVLLNLKNQGLIENSVFALYLQSNETLEGEFEIGQINSDRAARGISWSPLISKSDWKISFNGIYVNEKLLTRSQTAIVDTGTSLLVGSIVEVGRLASSLGAMQFQPGLYKFNCENIEKLPNLVIALENLNVSISFQEYVFKQDGFCILGMQASDIVPIQDPFWIFGDLFLRKVYSVFDIDHSRIGFALA
jgi:saccharopepsin